MRALSDQTYNAFVQEIVLEHKDCEDTGPGQGDGALEIDDDLVTLDDPRALHDGTTTAAMYFNQCVYQLSADIENESYKGKDTQKEQIQKEKLLLKAVNSVVASGKPNNTTNDALPASSVQVIDELCDIEDTSSIALLDPTITTVFSNSPTARLTPRLTMSTQTSSSSVKTPTVRSSSLQISEPKVSPHKMNLMNQTKNLDIALKEADNSEKALIVQEREIDLRKQQLLIDSEDRKNNNKLFSTVLTKFIDRKEDSQDIFVRLKSNLDKQRELIGEDIYNMRLKKITDDFVRSDSV